MESIIIDAKSPRVPKSHKFLKGEEDILAKAVM